MIETAFPCEICKTKTTGWIGGYGWRCPKHPVTVKELREDILKALNKKCNCGPYAGPCGRCNEILEIMDYKGEELLT